MLDWKRLSKGFLQKHHSVSLLLQDIDGLEVIGSSKPSTFVTVCRSPLLEKEEEEKENKEMKKENMWDKNSLLCLVIY